mmetsp:Transcript_29450/g.80920  ORF Transcript_29450/g.80920 Transcript_29450/m.80920 type:complete len:232 (+) Transcript_29450:85-780(+)
MYLFLLSKKSTASTKKCNVWMPMPDLRWSVENFIDLDINVGSNADNRCHQTKRNQKHAHIVVTFGRSHGRLVGIQIHFVRGSVLIRARLTLNLIVKVLRQKVASSHGASSRNCHPNGKAAQIPPPRFDASWEIEFSYNGPRCGCCVTTLRVGFGRHGGLGISGHGQFHLGRFGRLVHFVAMIFQHFATVLQEFFPVDSQIKHSARHVGHNAGTQGSRNGQDGSQIIHNQGG